MSSLQTIFSNLQQDLAENPELNSLTRNQLVAFYLQKHHGVDVAPLWATWLPSVESITRAIRKIQNDGTNGTNHQAEQAKYKEFARL